MASERQIVAKPRHGHTLSLLTIFGIVIGETRQKQVF